MGKIKRLRLQTTSHPVAVGTSPGNYQVNEGALESKITIHSYSPDDYLVIEVANYEDIEGQLNKKPDHSHWIEVRGLANVELLDYIREKYNIHKLLIEDIVHTTQRPKIDEYDTYLFAVSRMLCINEDLEVSNEQLSFILTEKVLISFHESYNDCLQPVRYRLESGKGCIRHSDSSYLLYELMDIVLDNYFSLLYKLGEELEVIEEIAYRRAGKAVIYESQQIKRIMLTIRRAAWPERDKINDMMRSTSDLITPQTKTFLKDAYDHCMQIIDLIESFKDITTSIIDMNLSFISNRMNEIMKVLTIISSIFIPLTFIAGVYGMNFAYQDPKTGKILEHNMPELYAENGYVYVMILMLFIAALQVVYFWRKGWLRS
ncbi:MAG TPA: magnesium/cobalt transporter CorA [Sphingobacteriaceae bacterium]|nr:magnesium/cobalt transporter CorA [Sphingobacteriaceae bacterium]